MALIVVGALVVGATGLAALSATASPVAAGTIALRSANPVTLAVIGDVPYGTAQEATVGDLVTAVNNDPKVRQVVHVGDFKSGSTTCSDARFAAARTTFGSFADPLVYTPGDNEWTDCHRVNNGAYNPLERLAAVRSTFFAEPGATIGGRPMRVESQRELVENVRWIQSRVAFATLHVVGSNNGLNPWTGLGFKTPTPEQTAEVNARIAERTADFAGEVLLLQGDTHEYVADNPLGLDNFTRIVVHGETLPFEYLRLTINPRGPDLFSWERVQVPQP